MSMMAAAAMSCAAAAVSCGDATPADRRAAPSPDAPVEGSAGCLELRGREHVTLANGRQVYVEPQNLHPFGRGFVIVGAPSFEFFISPTGVATPLGGPAPAPNGLATRRPLRSFIAVTVEDGVGTIVLMPPGVGEVDAVWSAPSGERGFSVLLTEVSDPTLPQAYLTLRRIVHAQYADGGWRTVQTLPAPPGARLMVEFATGLSRAGAGLAWAVTQQATPPPHELLLYRFGDGDWGFRPIMKAFPDRIDLVEDGAGGLWIAMAAIAPEFGNQRVSFGLLRPTSPDAGYVRIHAPVDFGRVLRPRFAVGQEGLAAAWTVRDPTGRTAWAAIGIEEGRRPRPVLLTDAAERVLSVATTRQATLFIVRRIDPMSGLRELRFYQVRADGPRLMGTLPDPYTGPFNAIALEGGEIVMVGPDFDAGPIHPSVRSLVLRLTLSC